MQKIPKNFVDLHWQRPSPNPAPSKGIYLLNRSLPPLNLWALEDPETPSFTLQVEETLFCHQVTSGCSP